MNQDQAINRLAQISGRSRKEVMEVLKRMSAMPEVQKELRKSRKR
jgi:signal recognition particle GTPase